ncbi:helix-turn-helix transcriptional regulator [Paraburkholderia aromaticivorans]|uniref:helix-turn-helix transcriptional regulator n=1 Tax=Paraburkholderia aromaticivorans TaxID=2026199 RepID=UPI003D67AA7B
MTVEPFQPLTKQDVAQLLHVSVRTVENLVSGGSMPAPARIGGRVFWHPDVLYGWLSEALLKPDEPSAGSPGAQIGEGNVAPEPSILRAAPVTVRTPAKSSDVTRAKARQACKLAT